jgi:hypothetical protein
VEFIIVIIKNGLLNHAKSAAENNRYLRKFLSDFAFFFDKKVLLVSKAIGRVIITERSAEFRGGRE